jgi:uncharacterized repeat protein (TIGR01451 family)
MAVHIASDGSVIKVDNQFVRDIRGAVNTTTPSISAIQAVGATALHLGLEMTSEVVVQQNIGGATQSVIMTGGGLSLDNIPVGLVYEQLGRGEVHLAWQLRVRHADDWWNVRTDAETGKVISKNNWIDNDNDYQVFPVPYVSPEDPGVSHSLVNAPADAIASPFGWHDTDGAAGAEYTDTRGNNVYAQEDANADDIDGFRPDGGANLIFDFAWDPALQPWEGTNQEAAIVNLFYWNNIIHDVFYHYGFDEASGNFQENNYGNGGSGNDPVQADAQDGLGMNNANFATPPDGEAPRMQMYLWNNTSPQRDGDFENSIIIHEYGHGISKRLVGGPSNVDCLSNNEQMGEGWSDWLALILTTKASDTDATARGMGPYVFGEPPDGLGIRPARYMVIDGMKLVACNPGFVDARDAILLADQTNNGGANQCHIWGAFAKRGLGTSADQGSSSSTTDGTAAFDLPLECRDDLDITKTANLSPVEAGGRLDYTLEVHNYTPGMLTDVTITDNVPADTTYVPGSADCGGSETGGIVTFPLGTMNSEDMATCTFQVDVNGGMNKTLLFADDMESGSDNWTVSHGEGSDDWTLGNSNPHSESFAWFADNVSVVSDQYLVLSNPVLLSGKPPILRFWHYYDTENTYDGGVVEISTDGGATWTDLGSEMTQNGYNGIITTCCSNPISGRQAFTGNSAGYIETLVDLSSYKGQNVQIRFRMATDYVKSDTGWYVDDVKIVDEVAILNEACVEANEGYSDCSSVTTLIIPDIVVSPDSLVSTQVADTQTTQVLEIWNIGSTRRFCASIAMILILRLLKCWCHLM